MKAIIFFGHGARDLRWREPFDRLVALWRVQYPQNPVELAFLELMQPSLSGAIKKIEAQGIKDIVVIPVFSVKGVIYATTSQKYWKIVGMNSHKFP